MKTKTQKTGFTLVEILVVIVIISILAVALIPRIINIQSRARDAARKADLQQIGTSLAIYNTDNATYPLQSGNLNQLTDSLNKYIRSIPNDPSRHEVSGLGSGDCSFKTIAGQYAYIPITQGGKIGGAFVLMAQTENMGSSSNRGFSGGNVALTGGCITSSIRASNLRSLICERTIAAGSTIMNGNICGVNGEGSNRYIYTN